jgi:hypothetical protein
MPVAAAFLRSVPTAVGPDERRHYDRAGRVPAVRRRAQTEGLNPVASTEGERLHRILHSWGLSRPIVPVSPRRFSGGQQFKLFNKPSRNTVQVVVRLHVGPRCCR